MVCTHPSFLGTSHTWKLGQGSESSKQGALRLGLPHVKWSCGNANLLLLLEEEKDCMSLGQKIRALFIHFWTTAFLVHVYLATSAPLRLLFFFFFFFFRLLFLKEPSGTSLVVQWVRFCAPTAGGPSSIPGRGTRSRMHAATKKSTCRN